MVTPKERKQWRSWYQRRKLAGDVFRRVKVDGETNWSLKKLAAEKHISVQELILTYIAWGLDNDREIEIRK